MNSIHLSPFIPLVIGLILFLLILGGIVTVITRLSLRINKAAIPQLKSLLAIAFLQILVDAMVAAALWGKLANPVLGLVVGIGITILSGLPIMKWLLHRGWKQTLGVWGVAAGFELVLLPICTVILLVIYVNIMLQIFPPVY